MDKDIFLGDKINLNVFVSQLGDQMASGPPILNMHFNYLGSSGDTGQRQNDVSPGNKAPVLGIR